MIASLTKEIQSNQSSILVVDDDPSTRELLQILFKSEGYPVLLAESPEQAEKLIFESSTPIDLAFIDTNYGEKSEQSGFDLAKKIKKQIPQLAFFIMSLDNTQENRHLSQGLGAIDFVEKDYDRILDSFKRFQRTSFLRIKQYPRLADVELVKLAKKRAKESRVKVNLD